MPDGEAVSLVLTRGVGVSVDKHFGVLGVECIDTS